MTVSELLESLNKSGVTVSVTEHGVLHVSAPPSMVTTALRHVLRERKREILIVLTTPVPRYTIEQLLATGKSTLGCVHGAKHHEAWVWRNELHRYVCQACAPGREQVMRPKRAEEVAS